MNDAFLMCCVECFTDVLCNVESFLNRDRAPCNSVGECFPFHKFEHQESGIVCLLKIVNGSDIGMI